MGIALNRVELLAQPIDTTILVYDNAAGTGSSDELENTDSLGGRFGELTTTSPPEALGEFTRYLTDNTMRDLWLVLTWGESA